MATAKLTAFSIAGFLGGIFFAGFGTPPGVFLGAGAASLLVFSRRPRPAGWLGIGLILGSLYYQAFFILRKSTFHPPADDSLVAVRIIGEPRTIRGGAAFPAVFLPPYGGRISVLADRDDFSYGEVITVRGKLQLPQETHELPFFAYPELQKTGRIDKLPRSALIAMRRRAVRSFDGYVLPQEAAFLKALLLGDRTGFNAEFKNDLARSGTSHLVALSGANVQLLVHTIGTLFILVLPRRGAFLMTSAVIIFFVFLVGGEPSIVRAAIMGILLLLSRQAGRLPALGHAALWAALGMALPQPDVLFMPGFQLSFLSFFGIAYLAPALQGAAASGRGFAVQAIETVAAQLAVLPVISAYFGNVSVIGFFTNMLVLAVIPLTMLFGFALLFIGLLLPALGAVPAALVGLLLRYELAVIDLGSRLMEPLAAGAWPWPWVLGYYGALLIFIRHRQSQRI